MDASVDSATELDVGEAAAGRPPDDHAGALAAVASSERVAMGVGAVRALHSVDQQTGEAPLGRAAGQFQVPFLPWPTPCWRLWQAPSSRSRPWLVASPLDCWRRA
jgi:hypothetical protein